MSYARRLAVGPQNIDAYTLGITLKVTLVPMLGVLAYRDLYDRVPAWAKTTVGGAPPPAGPATPSAAESIAPPPPPPPDSADALPLPPPPED